MTMHVTGRRKAAGMALYASAVMALLAVLALPTAVKGQQWTDCGTNNVCHNTGNVGVGTASPNLAGLNRALSVSAGTSGAAEGGVDIQGSATGSDTGYASLNFFHQGNRGVALSGRRGGADNSADFAIYTMNAGSLGERVRVSANGNVGIGTASPGVKLHVSGTTLSGITSGTAAEYPYRSLLVTTRPNNDGVADLGFDTNSTYRGALDFTGSTGNLQWWTNNGGGWTSPLTITGGGSVGIGTTSPDPQYKLDVNGSINVSGNISAKYQDVAEWVPSTQKLSAGTVVVLDTSLTNHVLASTKPYDTGVAGVVSASPGVILGEGGGDKVKVATTGRVKVRVDATRLPVHVGDLLVTSDVEGVAMKSIPVDLGGTPIHRPGTIIGKALEPLDKGTGEILVLLSLQ